MDQTLNNIKAYLFPTLVSILGMMIWNDVNEIKSDVKQLMAQSNIDKTRIDNLEREVYKTSLQTPMPPYKLPLQIVMHEVVGIRPEQDNKVRKYLTKI
jgi:hypothetical protein